jgi:prepilin-type N-terminal cleavage/methylation domain-containing protein
MEVFEMKIFRKNAKGFTLVEIMIVVAIIGILIAIAVPGFIRARTQSRNRACQENLTKIDGAKEQWALENNAAAGDAVAMADLVEADGSGYLKSDPVCPEGGTYDTTTVGADPTCDVGGDHSIAAITAAP